MKLNGKEQTGCSHIAKYDCSFSETGLDFSIDLKEEHALYLLGIDIGTTNSKAGLYDMNGNAIAIASRPTQTFQDPKGFQYYDPDQMWETVASAIREVTEKAASEQTNRSDDSPSTSSSTDRLKIAAIGITSMAESGVFIHKQTGKPASPFLPWFDTITQPQAEHISAQSDMYERFTATGLRGSFKLGLAKILWIREHYPEALNDAVWLSASGYIAYRLTGQMAVDYTLGARTYAFRIDTKQWDKDWIRSFGLSENIFPEALPSDAVMGHVQSHLEDIGLTEGTPVTIAGHDHVCSAMAVGAIVPEKVYDSMGTAETLVGTLPEKPLGRREYNAGLSFGCHIAKGRYFWMGGNSSSGGSVEWLRKQLGDPELDYPTLLQLLADVPEEPTGILYHPYLTGSGAPQPNPRMKASFIGITAQHSRGDLIKAVLEGTAYQLESIRREAEGIAGQPITRLTVVGGGTRNPYWLQVKADIVGCELEIPHIEEATMAGAAMTAGIAAGCYASAEEAAKVTAAARDAQAASVIRPDSARHEQYKKLYEEGYVKLADFLQSYFSN